MQVMQKLTEEEYNNLYVTSDLHFGHNQEFVYKNRGYNNPSEMNDDMIRIINQTVGEDGTLLHLGDFCLNTTQEDLKYIFSNLKIKALWLLWGNHNNPIQKSYGGRVQQVAASYYGLHVRFLDYYYTFKKGRKMYVCLHFPMAIWDGMSFGAAHLCGHSHGTFQLSRPEDKTHKILDCGWDIHRKPLTMQEIEVIIDSKHIGNKHHS
jgi:calcineurin-like phosphoesterase family protein